MKKNGFTLLELLVVIGIIGILVALATVSYSATQRSARDSKRKQDLVAIQNSLEQYYSQASYVYPTGSCTVAVNQMSSAWPVDPLTAANYSGVSGCTATTYCICALMEKNTAGNSSSAACSYSTATTTYYCVSNLQ